MKLSVTQQVAANPFGIWQSGGLSMLGCGKAFVVAKGAKELLL